MNLARRWGEKDVDALLESMTAEQAMEWEMHALVSPFPEDKIINAFATFAAFVGNVFAQKKDKTPWKVEDFVPKYTMSDKEKEKKAKEFQSTMLEVFRPKTERTAPTSGNYAVEKVIGDLKTTPPKRMQ